MWIYFASSNAEESKRKTWLVVVKEKEAQAMACDESLDDVYFVIAESLQTLSI